MSHSIDLSITYQCNNYKEQKREMDDKGMKKKEDKKL